MASVTPVNVVKVGPFGGHGGRPRDISHSQPPAKLTNITVYYTIGPKGIVNALGFTYQPGGTGGTNVTIAPWGDTKSGGQEKEDITLSEDEDVVEVFGSDNGNYITSLGFRTSTGTTYGPFGKTEATTFRIPVVNSKIVAFYGSSDSFLISLGAYAAPNA